MGNSRGIGECGSMKTYQGARRSSQIIPMTFGTSMVLGFCLVLGATFGISNAAAQESTMQGAGKSEVILAQPPAIDQGAAPISITLKDALERARKNDPTFIGASSDAKSAHEDRLQARNSMLPQISATSQYLGTQGNDVTPNGRFVTNDGIHVYRDWGILRQDLSPAMLMGTAYSKAKAGEALANAKAEIARRGLAVAVTKNFYALVVAQQKLASAQQALDQAKHFMDMAQSGERQGQASHSDSLKAEIQYRIQSAAYGEAMLTLEDARLNLAVMLFPTFSTNFTVVDDLDSSQALPAFPEVQAMATKENPYIRAAVETARQADFDVKSAKTAFLPTLTFETDYGIEANQFATHGRLAACAVPDKCFTSGPLPNLGYFMTVALNIPVWDWGTLRSRLHQSEYKQQTAKALLSQEQRLAISELYAAYNEATVARAAVEESRKTAEMATESLRLVNLRYGGGAAPATDVVDAQTTLLAARNGYIDAQARYKAAVATLQTITGSF
jgi:outer membrane protein TolC